MRTRTTTFTTVRSEGAILPADMLQRIASSDGNLDGLSPESYHLVGERLNEAINRAWNQMLAAWRGFQVALEKLPHDDPATSVTREKLLLPLFQSLVVQPHSPDAFRCRAGLQPASVSLKQMLLIKSTWSEH